MPLLITTPLLNYIAALFAAHLVTVARPAAGGLAETKMIPESIQLPWLFGEPRLHVGLFVAFTAGGRQGSSAGRCRLRDADTLPTAIAEHGGVTFRTILTTMSISGAICGLAGVVRSWASITGTSTERSRAPATPGRASRGAVCAGQPAYTVVGGVFWRRSTSVRRHGAPDQRVAARRCRHVDHLMIAVRVAIAIDCGVCAPAGGRLMEDILAIFDVALLISTVRLVSPILLAALGGCSLNVPASSISPLKGWMLIGSFFAIAGVVWTGNPYLGVLTAVAAAMLISFFLGVVVIDLKGNAIVAGRP